MTTPDSPWSTMAGRHAREVQLRMLAKEQGVIGEFATEVLTGRAQLHAILHSSILPDEIHGEIRGAIDEWNKLPEEERDAAIQNWATNTAQMIEALNSTPDTQPPPPPRKAGSTEEEWWNW
jgi:hypothetical protein